MHINCLTNRPIGKVLFTGLFLFTLLIYTYAIAFAQSFPYQQRWEEIEKKEINGQLKSLRPQVDAIYLQAKKDRAAQQVIRALLYQAKIEIITEDGKQKQADLLARFKSEIEEAATIEKSILQSLLAELLNEYYQQNRYLITNRTNKDTIGQASDFLTWTEADYQHEITKLYDASLHDYKRLQRESVDRWTFILDTAKTYRVLRPTVFDLLAHRALSYYNLQDQEGKKQQIFQQLLDQHANGQNKEAYLYCALQRLKMGKEMANNSTRVPQLKKLLTYAPRSWYTAEIMLQLVYDYQALSASTAKDRTLKRKVYADSILILCDAAATSYPETDAGKQLALIKSTMLRPEINLQTENINIPKQALPFYLSHKNVNKIYVKVLSYEQNAKGYLANEFNARRGIQKQSDIDSVLKKYREVQSYALDLKPFDDYQTHTTLAKFNDLETGEYLIAVSNNNAFQLDNRGVVTFQLLRVSVNALAFKNNEILLTNRENGKPIPKKAITIYQDAGNDNDLKVYKRVITGSDGRASYEGFDPAVKTGYLRLICQVEGEDLFFNTHQYLRLSNQPAQKEDDEEEAETKIQFFTDRGIYRPGQTVYFKGIVYQHVKGKRKVLSGYKAKVNLYDPNDDELHSLELHSNTYGSIFGSFVLPLGKLTGQYYLEEEDCEERKDFQVEEYKRPKFEVVMDTVKETWMLADSVLAKGKAQSYAGASISNGKVSYRVIRHHFYPYQSWSKAGSYYPHSTEEIAVGETTTDAEGKFEVPFFAKAAEEKKEGLFRFYNYNIAVSVTDVNGETHEGDQIIAVGDKSIVLKMAVSDKMNLDQLDSISFQTTNLNGQPVAANGKIQLRQLIAPKRVLRKTRFGDIEYMLQDSLAFISNFPHLPYGNEQQTQNWPKGEPVLNASFNSAKRQAVNLIDKNALEEGTYLLEAYVLDGEDTLRTSQLVQLYRTKTKRPQKHEFLHVAVTKPLYEAGETATIQFASAIPDATVLIEIEEGGKIVKRQQLQLSNNIKILEVPIDKNILDNRIYVHYYMGHYNAVEKGVMAISVQQESNKLVLSTSTFRDKLQPGQEETWELKISGTNKDKVAAEVLAAMYDASLNQFANNSFFFPDAVNYTYSNVPAWDISSAYGISYAIPIMATRPDHYYPAIRYENLNHFGFSFADNSWKQQNYLSGISRQRNERTAASGVMDFNAVGADFKRESELQEVVVVGYGQQSRQALTGALAGVQIRGAASAEQKPPLYVVDGEMKDDMSTLDPATIFSMQVMPGEEATALYGSRGVNGVIVVTTMAAAEQGLQVVTARKNLKETAFFYPNLQTDEEGNVKIRFTTPESLTQWKLMVFAHTPTLETGYLEKTVLTNKELMVVPNAPRFLRTGDELVISTKIVNLSDGDLNGAAKLMLFDAFTMKPVDSLYALYTSAQSFETEKGGSKELSWRIKIPASQELLAYRVVASAGQFSDGEEAVLPILPNKMLVTETLSLFAKERQAKAFTMDALAAASANTQHVRLTLELTANPIWYAIQALPYLQEYPHECSEQLFARLYSALVSKKIVEGSPKIKMLFDDWYKKGTLQSKLEANEELKALLLEETPWVQEAEDESERMKRLALLFDINNLRNQWQNTYQQLIKRQLPSGAFPWFDGGKANLAITTHIVAGFGHMKQLKIVMGTSGDSAFRSVLSKAIAYLDGHMLTEMKQHRSKEYGVVFNMIHYLYARSYFLQEYPLEDEIKKYVLAYLSDFTDKQFTENLQGKAMLAVIYQRFGQQENAKELLNTLREYAVVDEEKGMYWKENRNGWNWWQSAIETQAVLIEAFDGMEDVESVEQMKLWLIKNKQSNHWASTKATTEAIYALLFAGKDWIDAEGGVKMKVGAEELPLKELAVSAGYIKTAWVASEIKPEMARVEIDKSSAGPVWGALYWQYLAPLTSIEKASNGIELEKELFIKEHTAAGPVLRAISPQTVLKVGDLVTVRVIVRADRAVSFIHLKDMRASGFEPVSVLSAYKWQDGLGYYESTRDAATNFFIDHMPKGTYVFEYNVRANNAGIFANGITTIQSMYAPEMGAHSEGTVVHIQK